MSTPTALTRAASVAVLVSVLSMLAACAEELRSSTHSATSTPGASASDEGAQGAPPRSSIPDTTEIKAQDDPSGEAKEDGELALPEVVFAPVSPQTGDAIEARVDPSEDVDAWSWTVDGMPSPVTTAVVPAEATARGQVWRAVARLETTASVAGVVTVQNTPPRVDSARIEAQDGGLTCATEGWSDPDDDAPDVLVTWYRVTPGLRAWVSVGTVLGTGALLPGDAVVCEATPLDAFDVGVAVESEPVEIVNVPPSVAEVTVVPDDPNTDEPLRCEVAQISDPEGDLVNLAWSWEADGEAIEGATAAVLENAPIGVPVRCVVTPSDLWGQGEPVASEPVVVRRDLTVRDVALGGDAFCQPWACAAVAPTSADGTPLELAYRWEVAGATVPGAEGAILSEDAVNEGDSVRCFVRAWDGTFEDGERVYGPEAASEVATAGAGEVGLGEVLIRDRGRAGDLIACSTEVTDACSGGGTLTYIWSINGAPDASQTGTVYNTRGLDVGDELTCTVLVDAGGTRLARRSNVMRLVTSGWDIVGEIVDGAAGYAVAVADDLDGDQFAEIIVGAPNAGQDNAPNAGQFYVVGGRDDIDRLSLMDITAGGRFTGRTIKGDSGGYNLNAMACAPNNNPCPRNSTNTGDTDAHLQGPNGARLGFSIAYPGDINNDGAGDVIVSAPYRFVRSLWRGRTYVLSGASLLGQEAVQLDLVSNGETPEAGYVFDGECGRRPQVDIEEGTLDARDSGNGDLSGYRVAPLGDVNGDGLADFAIGAVNNGDNDEGAVYVVYGRDDGQRVTASDLFVRGCDTEVISSDGPRSGEAGFGIVGFVSNGNVSDPNWGRFISPAGDFDGDGYSDILLHATLGSPYSYVVRGGPAGKGIELEQVPVGDAVGEPGPVPRDVIPLWHGEFRFVGDGQGGGTFIGRAAGGNPAGGGGDVNGDGIDDIAFHVTDFDNRAFLNVVYGDPDPDAEVDLNAGASGERGFFIGGFTDTESFEGELSIVGDINGDGYDDIALGIPNSNDSGARTGQVVVVFGAPTNPGITIDDLEQGIGGFVLSGVDVDEEFGWTVAGGDIDGDGLDDLVIGAPGARNEEGERVGRVIVEYGRDFSGAITQLGGTAPDRLEGTEAGESFIGGQGDDLLIGGGGPDIIYGGAGDDTIVVGDLNFRRVRGGAGDDTLRLTPSVPALDLAAQGGLVQDIERIELQGQTLTISKVRVLRLSDISNRLIVGGSQGRVNTVTGDDWRPGEPVVEGGVTYNTYVDGYAELWIDARLETGFPPTVKRGEIAFVENQPLGAVIEIDAVDPDGDSAAMTWEIIDNGDALGAYNLTSDGTLTVARADLIDFEGPQPQTRLVIAVTDEDGLVQTSEVILVVQDVNEPPEFIRDAVAWSVEEGGSPEDILGQLAARDQDGNDVVTFAILEGDEALFRINPQTGELQVQQGTALDFETQTLHTITVQATDVAGLTDEATIALSVLDRDLIERNVDFTFTLREWALFEDGPTSGFDAINLFGDQENVGDQGEEGTEFFCFGLSRSSTDRFYDNVLFGGFGIFPDLPVSLEIEAEGRICAKGGFAYDSGKLNADIPVTLELSLPDEIVPGEPFTLTSQAVVNDGAAVWGATPRLEALIAMHWQDVDILMEFCEEDDDCSTLFDTEGPVTGQYQDSLGLQETTWDAEVTLAEDRTTFTSSTPENFVATAQDITMEGEDGKLYALQALLALTGKSNVGRFRFPISELGPGLTMVVDYVTIDLSYVLRPWSEWTIGLDLEGFDGQIILEDGSVIDFEVGADAEITIPADADSDGDGKVAMEIVVVPRANYRGDTRQIYRVGHSYTVASATFTPVDDEETILAPPKRVGPAMEDECIPRRCPPPFCNPFPALPGRRCREATLEEDMNFSPSGFSTRSIFGAVDLAQ